MATPLQLVKPSRHTRGFSLIFVATMLAVLSFGAATLLSQVRDNAAGAGAHLRVVKTNLVGQNGALLGSHLLENVLFADATAPIDLTALQRFTTLRNDDPLCVGLDDCTGWYLLADKAVVGSGGQTARIGVTCLPNGCKVAPAKVVAFKVRALGAETGLKTATLVEAFLQLTDS